MKTQKLQESSTFRLPFLSSSLLLAAGLLISIAPQASAQTTLTWRGAGGNTNASNAGNWVEAVGTVNNTNYHIVYSSAAYVGPNLSTNFNSTGFGFSSITVSDSDRTYTLTGAAASLSGNVTVNSGNHTLNTNITSVTVNSTWNIATGAELTRGGSTLGLASDRTITKTGGGTLIFGTANSGIAGTIALEAGTLSLRNVDNVIGSGSYSVSGGTLEVRGNTARTNSNAAVQVSGNATFATVRNNLEAGVVNTMGNLTIGANTMTVTASSNMNSGTAGFIFGTTTMNGNATFETVNNGVGATTRVTLGAVGESGGSRALTKTGSGELSLTGINTYTGSTTVSAGTLRLEDNAELRFAIGSNGVNNALLGSATATLNGDFRFDLTGAGTTIGNTWSIVDVSSLSETFGGTFQVFSTLGSFTNNSGVWSITENSVTYEFSQSLGTLTVIPEPSTWALLAGFLMSLIAFRRVRRAL
jgi:autotransporter-associated beta strand protein